MPPKRKKLVAIALVLTPWQLIPYPTLNGERNIGTMKDSCSNPDIGLSVGFISLGCAKNLVDSQVMAGTLVTEGIALAPSPEEADIVLVNTCSFIQDARDESFDAIESACELKRQGDCRYVVVAGCLPQRYREDVLEQQLPIEEVVERISKLAAGTPLAVRHAEFIETLRRGDSVYVIPFKREGIVERIRRKRETIVVFLDSKQVEVPFSEISRPP